MQQPSEGAKAELEQLRIDYAQWFAIAPESVLQDLQRFCRAHENTGDRDPFVRDTLNGRREVWLHMQELAQLDPQTLFKLYMMRKMQNARLAHQTDE